MKKILALACTITCIFGLTACGSEESYTEFEQQKIMIAETIATEDVIPFFANFFDDENQDIFAENTLEEIEYIVGSQPYYITAEGTAVTGGVESFHSAADEIGGIQSLGTPESEFDGNTIIVTVPVTGTLRNAEVELIFSNDMFMILESISLNLDYSFGELMSKAALNTVIGMGTVFIVLIVISFIISLFKFIPAIQEKLFGKNKKQDIKSDSIDNTISQIVEKEESDAADDLELVAVIAAAIAASEGAASTDGFVVRSIRRAGRR